MAVRRPAFVVRVPLLLSALRQRRFLAALVRVAIGRMASVEGMDGVCSVRVSRVGLIASVLHTASSVFARRFCLSARINAIAHSLSTYNIPAITAAARNRVLARLQSIAVIAKTNGIRATIHKLESETSKTPAHERRPHRPAEQDLRGRAARGPGLGE